MKSILILTMVILSQTALAGTLIHENSLDRYELSAECVDSKCNEIDITLLSSSQSRPATEKVVRLTNDKVAIEKINRSVCKQNLKDTAVEAGLYMIAAGPLMAKLVHTPNQGIVRETITRGCAFAAGVAFNVVAFPYFAGRGAFDIARAMKDNRGFSEALNVLLFKDETLNIDHEVNHLIVNGFFYGLLDN